MRKLTILFAALFLFTSLSFAQNFATKGTVELGGSLGFSSTTNVYDGESADNALSTFIVQPYVGYFVVNSLELGLIPSFIYESHGDASRSTLGIYFAPAWNFDLKSNLFPFIEGRIGYNTSTSKYEYLNPYGIWEEIEETSSGLAWGLKGGVKVKVGNSALVNLALSYDQITMDPEDWDGDRNGQNIFGINAGFTIFLGR